MNRKKEACHCRNISYGKIEDAVKNGAATLQEVMDVTGAGKGCGKPKREKKPESSGSFWSSGENAV